MRTRRLALLAPLAVLAALLAWCGARTEPATVAGDGASVGSNREPARLVGRARDASAPPEPATAPAPDRRVAHEGAAATAEAAPLVPEGPGEVAGTVVFPDGTPGAGVAVEASISLSRGGSWGSSTRPGLLRRRARADADGRFRIEGLRPGPYEVSAPADGAQGPSVPADPGDEDVRVVLRRHRTRVHVVDTSGRPLPDARLEIVWNHVNGHGTGYAPGRLSDAGVLELWGEPGNRHVVFAARRGFLPVEACFPVGESAWSRDVLLALRPDDGQRGRVRVLLTREDGSRIEDVAVEVRAGVSGYELEGCGRLRADPSGEVRLPAGSWRIEARPAASLEAGYAGYDLPATGAVVVRDGETTDLWLVSRRGGRLRVGARDEEGADLEAVAGFFPDPRADASFPRSYSRTTTGLEPGPLLAPGPWRLEVSYRGARTERRTVVVEPGRIVDVGLVLVPDSEAGGER